jgi:hypothetical protein
MIETPADHLTFEGRHQHIREVKEIGRRRGLELRAEGNESAWEATNPSLSLTVTSCQLQ